MNRKDISELKKRFKKESCTFTKVCGCYVNSEKKPLFEFKENFLNLPNDEFFKYLEIAKKTLSGTIGNNLLELNFPLNESFENEKQQLFMMLKKSGLKEDVLLKMLYESIIEDYDFSGNYLILLFHDVYDVMMKTSDNRKLDESEEVYEYIICAICPVSLSKPGLGYFDKEEKIKARIRDWIVEAPTVGFTFPGFIDRSTDVNTLMYYTKNVKEPHMGLMTNTLGCLPKQTATIQMTAFESIVKSSLNTDANLSDKVFIDIQENLNTMVEEHHEIYDSADEEPITLSKEKVKTLLKDSGICEEDSLKIERSYEEQFGENPPLAENLIDSKSLKKNAQKKKEAALVTQIEALETKLKAAETSQENNNAESDDLESLDPSLETQDDELSKNYDIVLHVKPEKLNTIKTQLINGQRCIVVPINDNEQATINGIEDLLKDLS